MTDNIFRIPANDRDGASLHAEVRRLLDIDPDADPVADRAVAEVLGEGVYIAAVAIDAAEGDYTAALGWLDDATTFVRGRQREQHARHVSHFATEIAKHRPLTEREQGILDRLDLPAEPFPGPEAA